MTNQKPQKPIGFKGPAEMDQFFKNGGKMTDPKDKVEEILKTEPIFKELKKYVYDTLLEWTDFDPDGQISFSLDSKFREALSLIEQEVDKQVKIAFELGQLEVEKARIEELENAQAGIKDSNHFTTEVAKSAGGDFITIYKGKCFECYIQDRLSELKRKQI